MNAIDRINQAIQKLDEHLPKPTINPIDRLNKAWAKFDTTLEYTMAQTKRELQILESRKQQNERLKAQNSQAPRSNTDRNNH